MKTFLVTATRPGQSPMVWQRADRPGAERFRSLLIRWGFEVTIFEMMEEV